MGHVLGLTDPQVSQSLDTIFATPCNKAKPSWEKRQSGDTGTPAWGACPPPGPAPRPRRAPGLRWRPWAPIPLRGRGPSPLTEATQESRVRNASDLGDAPLTPLEDHGGAPGAEQRWGLLSTPGHRPRSTPPAAEGCLRTDALGGCGFPSSLQGPTLTTPSTLTLPGLTPPVTPGRAGRGRKRDERALYKGHGSTTLRTETAMRPTSSCWKRKNQTEIKWRVLFSEIFYRTETLAHVFWSHHLPLSCT